MADGRLSGHTVLVTGGAHGIGAAQVSRFVAEGASLVVGDVLADDAERVAESVGERTVPCSLDVRSADDWSAALELGARTFGAPVTGMVNNAGLSVTRMIEDSSLDDYLDVVMVNQVGTFLSHRDEYPRPVPCEAGLRACIPVMCDAAGGSIVTISSILGRVAWSRPAGMSPRSGRSAGSPSTVVRWPAFR